jgi:hypothetical protein
MAETFTNKSGINIEKIFSQWLESVKNDSSQYISTFWWTYHIFSCLTVFFCLSRFFLFFFQPSLPFTRLQSSESYLGPASETSNKWPLFLSDWNEECQRREGWLISQIDLGNTTENQFKRQTLHSERWIMSHLNLTPQSWGR